MKSYIKLMGPPILETIKKLEKIAVNMPEVCVMSLPIETTMGISGRGIDSNQVERTTSLIGNVENINSYFGAELPEERCNNIISKSGESLGEYDFYFEWFKKPSMDEIMMLIEKIDEATEATGAKYTITTK
jgi:hypothetical protein